MQERLGKRDAERLRGLAERKQRVADGLERAVAHQARDGQRQLGPDRAVGDHDKAALERDDAVDRDRHVAVVGADDADVVAVVPDRRGDRAALEAEAVDEAEPDVAVDAVPRDDRDLDHVLSEVDASRAALRREIAPQMLGQDFPRDHPDHGLSTSGGGDTEALCRNRRRLDALKPDRRDRLARREQRLVDDPAGGDHRGDCASFEVVEEDDVGAPAGCDHAAVGKPKRPRRRQRSRAVDRERPAAPGDQRADHVVEVTLLGDVKRVAVVGAEREERRGLDREEGAQRREILRHRALADQHGHALADLLQRFVGAGRLVVGADAGGKIAVEVASAQQRRMAVNVAIGEALELRDAARVGGKHPGDVHELGEPKNLRVIAIAQKVGGLDPRARGLELGCRNAARELHAQVHDHALGRGEEIVERGGAEDVRHLVRVADRRRHAARQHAALELERRDERGFDMQMRVDEARDGNAPAAVDLARAVIFAVGADDGVAADRDIGRHERTGDEVEQAHALDDEVGRRRAAALDDAGGERPRSHRGLTYFLSDQAPRWSMAQ